MFLHRHDLHESATVAIDTIRVTADANPVAVGAAIAHSLRDKQRVHVQAIGMSAVNQALKSTIVARTLLTRDRMDLVLVPTFAQVQLENNERTAVRLSVYRRDRDETSESKLSE